MPDYRSRLSVSEVDQLLANHRPGYSLERAFYRDPTVFEVEYRHIISRQWQYVDHINRIPQKGDYILFRIASEELIVVRGEGDTVYAHHNVCRHRGSRVCTTAEGHGLRLTCPYHAWSYRLDGSLANARAMPADFDPADFGLRGCQVRVFEGLIFINLTPADRPTVDFSAIETQLQPWIAQADLRHTKIAGHRNYRSPVNWKIALENYFECYHCVTSHPELCKVQLHTLRDAIGTEKATAVFDEHNADWQAKAQSLGHMVGSMRANFALPDSQNYMAQAIYAERMLIHHDIDGAYNKLKPDLNPKVSKLLGSYMGDDGGQVDWGILPSAFLYTSCTSTVIMRLTPLGPEDTDMTMSWFVHPDAQEGVDYDLEGITWLDHVTMMQDMDITENTQAGVNSRVYEPGPYAELEFEIKQVHDDYLRAMRWGRKLDLGMG